MLRPLYMLDTNTVSYLLKGKSALLEQRIKEVDMSCLCISVITEAELLRGVAKYPQAKKLAEVVNNFLMHVDISPWDSSAASAYAKLRRDCDRVGKSLSAMDMLIAAHANAASATLVTHDKAFFQIHTLLDVVDWTCAKQRAASKAK